LREQIMQVSEGSPAILSQKAQNRWDSSLPEFTL